MPPLMDHHCLSANAAGLLRPNKNLKITVPVQVSEEATPGNRVSDREGIPRGRRAKLAFTRFMQSSVELLLMQLRTPIRDGSRDDTDEAVVPAFFSCPTTGQERRIRENARQKTGTALYRHIRGDRLVLDIFESQVASNPKRCAFSHAGRETSYGALNHKADKLARILKQNGVVSGTTVGLSIPPSPDMLVCWLAVLKTSAAIVPFNRPRRELQWPSLFFDHGLQTAIIQNPIPPAPEKSSGAKGNGGLIVLSPGADSAKRFSVPETTFHVVAPEPGLRNFDLSLHIQKRIQELCLLPRDRFYIPTHGPLVPIDALAALCRGAGLVFPCKLALDDPDLCYWDQVSQGVTIPPLQDPSQS